MHDLPSPRLSDLVDALKPDGAADPAVLVPGAPAIAEAPAQFAPSNRRTFLARASTLSLARPGFGAALAACAPDDGDARRDSTGAGSAGASGRGDDSLALYNSNSRLDSAVLRDRAMGRRPPPPRAPTPLPRSTVVMIRRFPRSRQAAPCG